MLVELPRPALADRDDLDSLSAADQRAYLRSLGREGTGAAVRAGRARGGAARRGHVRPDVGRLRGDRRRLRPRRALEPRRARAAGAAVLSRDERAGAGARRAEAAPAVPRPAGEPIAILDTGAAAPGYDALDRDGDPAPGADPRAPARRETSGDGARRDRDRGGGADDDDPGRRLRLGRRRSTARRDTLIAGLERAVDPNGDGAVDDAVRVALVGVNAPYAGFGDSPEAQAVRGAGKLGTLVVAPGRQRGAGAAAERRRRLAGSGARRAHRRRDRGRRGRPARRRSPSAAASSPARPPSAARRRRQRASSPAR